MGNKKVKETRNNCSTLRDEEILELAIASGYSFESVKQYYETFMIDCPSGKLSREQFREIYKQLYPNSRSTKFCDRIFKIFDYSDRNYLDFEEFLIAITVTMNGSTTEKLKCAFKIYDLNGDGFLDRKELKQILSHIHEMLGERSHSANKIAAKQVDLIFEKFDLEDSETLSLDQFIAGCLKDDYLNTLFSSQPGFQQHYNSNESLNSSQLGTISHREKLGYHYAHFKERFQLFKWIGMFTANGTDRMG